MRFCCRFCCKSEAQVNPIQSDFYRVQLSSLRNVEKKEGDFLVTVDNRPWFCVEAKYQDKAISANLGYFQERLDIPYAFQVIRTSGIDVVRRGIRLISADRFLGALI